ncbi:MAG: heavy-metal-associated domain-containing protein [Fimbriimonadaceae bacterium]|nr:heavy-metal-associated domain-containing protein [Fimbriimonadaceae bacterium]
MTTHLKIDGMSCGHCVNSATKALKAVPGVESAEVDLAAGTATVVGTAGIEALVAAVEEEGFQAYAKVEAPDDH